MRNHLRLHGGAVSHALKLTQDGTGSRTFTCGGMANLGVVAPDVGKTSIQTFYAPTASTLQAMGSMWCFDCNPKGLCSAVDDSIRSTRQALFGARFEWIERIPVEQ